MSWYSAGTVTVANGSPVVTGAGTDFVANVATGDAWQGPDGRAYEIAGVQSATQLTLARPYMGASAGGQGYSVQPTQSFARDLALAAATLLGTFGAVRDTIGQGLIGDGTPAAPGIRFTADPDTGLARLAANTMALVSAGVARLVADGQGRVGIGTTAPGYPLEIVTQAGPYSARNFNASPATDQYNVSLWAQGAPGSPVGYVGTGGPAVANAGFRGAFVVGTQNAAPLVLLTADNERLRVDAVGNVGIAVAAPSEKLQVAGNICHFGDGTNSFGTPTRRASVIYAASGAINTSDEREKKFIGTVPDAWLDAWTMVEWQRFKFRGRQRWHIGLVAQHVRDAYAFAGLDAQEIGLLCYDEWPATAGRPAGDRWGLRYDECLAMEVAWQRRRLDRLEARLAELEG